MIGALSDNCVNYLCLLVREPPQCGVQLTCRKFFLLIAEVPVLVMRAVLRVLLEMDWHRQVHELLEQGLDHCLALTRAGDNLLHYACSFGASDCVRVILQHVASINTTHTVRAQYNTLFEYVNVLDDAGRSPLVSWVRHNAQLETVSAADAMSAPATLLFPAELSGGGLLLLFGAQCTSIDHRGRTVLLHACDGGVASAAAVHAVLQSAVAEIARGSHEGVFSTLRAYIQHVSSAGDTALYRAAQGNGSDNEAIVRRLLAEGALGGPEGGSGTHGALGSASNPLIAAVLRSRVAVAQALLGALAPGTRGASPLAAPCAVCSGGPSRVTQPEHTADTRLMQQIQQAMGSSPLAWALAAIKSSSDAANAQWLRAWWWDKTHQSVAKRISDNKNNVQPACVGTVYTTGASIPALTSPADGDGDASDGSAGSAGSAFGMLAGDDRTLSWGSDSDSDGDGRGADATSMALGGGTTDGGWWGGGVSRPPAPLEPPPAVAMLAFMGALWGRGVADMGPGGHMPAATPLPPQAWGGCRGRSLATLLRMKFAAVQSSSSHTARAAELVFGGALLAEHRGGALEHDPPLTVQEALVKLGGKQVALHFGVQDAAGVEGGDGAQRWQQSTLCLQGDGLRAAASLDETSVLARALLHAQVAWHRRRRLIVALRG